MTLRWNYDKPHRCPECHTIWTYGEKYSPSEGWEKGESLNPRWWKTYDCYHCGAVFSGRWSWFERIRDRLRLLNRRRKWVNRDRRHDL